MADLEQKTSDAVPTVVSSAELKALLSASKLEQASTLERINQLLARLSA